MQKDALKRFLTAATNQVRKDYFPGEVINKRNAAIAAVLGDMDDADVANPIARAFELATGSADGTITGLIENGSTTLHYQKGTVLVAKDHMDKHDYPVGTPLVCINTDDNTFAYFTSGGVLKTDGNLTFRRRHIKLLKDDEIAEFVDAMSQEKVAKIISKLDVSTKTVYVLE